MSEKAPVVGRSTPEVAKTIKPEKKVYKAALIDTSSLVEDQARDIADHKMTESREDRSSNWMKRTVTRIWKHNLFQEYYRQTEIQKARSAITRSGNLYEGEEGGNESKHKEAMGAVIDRFTSEYESEMLRDDELGSKREASTDVNGQIKSLIKSFAENPDMEEAAFIEERNRILSREDPEFAQEGRHYSDNLFTIANEVRKSFSHGEKIADDAFDVEVTLGKARGSLHTEAQKHTFDRVVEKMQNSKVGRFVANEPAAIAAGALVYSGAKFFGLSALRSNFGKIGTFGLSAVAAGAIAGAKESARLERERAQHIRESAKGMTFEKDAPRRKEMEENRYESRDASGIINSLESGLIQVTSGKPTPESLSEIIDTLADLESRIKLGDERKIDLVSYSRFDQVEQERTKLDLLRAKLKVALRKDPVAQELGKGNVDSMLDDRTHSKSLDLIHEKEGLTSKDRIFTKMKHAKVAKTALTTMAVGATAGFVFQEAAAAIEPHHDGIFSGVFKSLRSHGQTHSASSTEGLEKNATALEGLRRYLAGESPRLPFGHGHELVLGKTHMELPDGVQMHANTDGTYDIIHGEDVLSSHARLEFDSHGDLTEASRAALAKEDIYGSFSHVAGETTQVFHEKAEDYIKHTAGTTHVHRELWYDNDTPKPVFDKNELKEWWGGTHNTGLDEKGNYVFNMQHMFPGGSYHADQSVDAPAAIKNPGLKMLFSLSRSTQHQVFEIKIGSDGMAVIPKDSEIAKLMFKNVNGHAIFTGQFAEVAQSMDHTSDGAEGVRVLSTYIGHGREMIDQTTKVITDVPSVRMNVPDTWNYDVPPFIPIPLARTPLERGKTPNHKDNVVSPMEFTYYFGGTPSASERDSYKNEFSDTLRDNPDAALDPKRETEEYLERQRPEYIQELRNMVDTISPMKPECELSICIPVAGHQEENNIERTLSSYLHQTASPDSFELVLFVNYPDKDPEGKTIIPDKTAEKIAEFKEQHPELNIRVMNKVLPHENAKMGYIRKFLTDATLLRSDLRGDDKELILVSNDADVRGIAPEYVSNFINKLERSTNADAAMGQLDWDPEAYIRNPLVHIGTRLMQYMEMQVRKRGLGISSSGANFAFKGSIYAAIGGYSANVNLAEDVDLGRRISAARAGSIDRTPITFGGEKVSRLYTSARRAEKAVGEGLSPAEQWKNGFSAFDDEVRRTRWEDTGSAPDYSNPEVVKQLTQNLEDVMNRTLVMTKSWYGDVHFMHHMKRSLGWLGVTYEMTGPSTIRITDASRLIEGLKAYEKDGMDIMARKTGV